MRCSSRISSRKITPLGGLELKGICGPRAWSVWGALRGGHPGCKRNARVTTYSFVTAGKAAGKKSGKCRKGRKISGTVRNPMRAKALGLRGRTVSTTRVPAMNKISAIAAIIMALSTNFALAQANPNQGATTGSQSNEQQRENSVPGNPSNPGPRPNQGATTGSQSNEQQRENSVPGNPSNPRPR